MDTDTRRVASVMQNPPPPSGGPTSRACLKTTRPQAPPERRRAGQKPELALGRLQPATAGKRKGEGEGEEEMRGDAEARRSARWAAGLRDGAGNRW